MRFGKDVTKSAAHDGEKAGERFAGDGPTDHDKQCLNLRRDDSISSVIDRMTKGKFRHMPKDRLAGMVSIGDVLKWHIETIRQHVHQLEELLVEFELARL